MKDHSRQFDIFTLLSRPEHRARAFDPAARGASSQQRTPSFLVSGIILVWFMRRAESWVVKCFPGLDWGCSGGQIRLEKGG